jgi:septum formation protein
MIHLVLASSSPYRQALLTRLRMPFEVYTADLDEKRLPNESIEEHVKRLSLEKSLAASQLYPHAYCIGSDEVAGLKNEILGKPLTHENAIKQLKSISGQTITFYKGLALVNASKNLEEYRLSTTHVTFHKLTDKMIESYLQKEKPYHCAASFQSETLGSALITQFESDDPTAIIGLPLINLTDMLMQAGIEIL